MATAPVKSQPLHNFNLPSLLKWGRAGTATSHRLRRPPPPPESEPDSDRVPTRSTTRPNNTNNNNVNSEGDEGSKPWKLRPRKTTTSSFLGESSSMNDGAAATVAVPSERESVKNNMRLRGLTSDDEKNDKKRKLWIALSKEEIEEDIFIMTGARPARRPKKRAKNVQKQLDSVFPGLWLVGMSADAFRVSEAVPAKR